MTMGDRKDTERRVIVRAHHTDLFSDIITREVYTRESRHILSLQDRNIRKLEDIEGLYDCVELTRLNLGANIISRVEGLAAFKSLESLSLGGNFIENMEWVPQLVELKHLRRVWLCSNRIRRFTNVHVFQALPALEILDLSYNLIERCPPEDEAAVLSLRERGVDVLLAGNLFTNRALGTIDREEEEKERDQFITDSAPHVRITEEEENERNQLITDFAPHVRFTEGEENERDHNLETSMLPGDIQQKLRDLSKDAFWEYFEKIMTILNSGEKGYEFWEHLDEHSNIWEYINEYLERMKNGGQDES
jgi:hypothetical protein